MTASALLRNDAAPQEPHLAAGVMHDVAVGVEDQHRATVARVGGPGRDCRIVRDAVAGEGDPCGGDARRELLSGWGAGGGVCDLGVVEDKRQIYRLPEP